MKQCLKNSWHDFTIYKMYLLPICTENLGKELIWGIKLIYLRQDVIYENFSLLYSIYMLNYRTLLRYNEIKFSGEQIIKEC